MILNSFFYGFHMNLINLKIRRVQLRLSHTCQINNREEEDDDEKNKNCWLRVRVRILYKKDEYEKWRRWHSDKQGTKMISLYRKFIGLRSVWLAERWNKRVKCANLTVNIDNHISLVCQINLFLFGQRNKTQDEFFSYHLHE